MTAPTPRAARRARRGYVLVLVLAALALVGVLAAGAAFVAAVRIRGLAASARAPSARARAELAAVAALTTWDPRASALAAGDSLALASAPGARLSVVRLSRRDYALLARAWDADDRGARAGILLAVRRDSLAVASGAALTARGDVVARDRATVSAADARPVGWVDCAPAAAGGSAVEVARAGAVQVGAASHVGTVAVTPRAADSLTYLAPGSVAWDSLVAHADVVLHTDSGAVLVPAPLVAAGRCVSGDASWGEPLRAGAPCEQYFPVIAVRGALVVRDGRGQGTLLVDGDLTLDGTTYFAGLVVVRGRLRVADAARIVGAALVLDGAAAGTAIADDATIARSACAVAHAVAGAGMPRAGRPRAWAPLY